MVQAEMSPEVVADKVLDVIREEELYILTHPEFNEPIRQRVDGILAGRNPPWQTTQVPNSESVSHAS